MFVSSVNAQSTLALQEKCAKSAKEFYASVQKTDKETFGSCLSSYECHYNKKVDKCFILLHMSCVGKDGSYLDDSMGDVFGNRVYAVYSCHYDKEGVLEWRSCLLGDMQFNMMNGFEFNKQTRKWDIISEAYTNSLKNPFSDPMKEKFDKWVRPFMEE